MAEPFCKSVPTEAGEMQAKVAGLGLAESSPSTSEHFRLPGAQLPISGQTQAIVEAESVFGQCVPQASQTVASNCAQEGDAAQQGSGWQWHGLLEKGNKSFKQ